MDHFDILVVGAGISGIDAAYRLQTECPGKNFLILEARHAIGGTWDLFRYPGVRSDSDMHTLGFPFRPWRGDRSIVDGPTIRAYVQETARVFGIDRKIRFGQRVTRASWSSADSRWTVEINGGETRLTCAFLYMCSGYYDYDRGYTPDFPGIRGFAGRVVHAQHWPEDLVLAGRRVLVIGSGATAVSLVPTFAETAAHVTIVQRSPTYVVSRAATDPLAIWARRHLPQSLADAVMRWKDVLVGAVTYALARRLPGLVRRAIIDGVRKGLGPGHDVEKDFTPAYNPWDQRICLIPDGDLFAAIRSGRVSIATDTIGTFTETGITLTSGSELKAEIVVLATGLVVRLMGGMEIVVDGAPFDPADRLVYKGMMLSGVPNLALAFGYINASWTLRCDLTARTLCRLLRHMDRRGYAMCAPRHPGSRTSSRPLLNFTSGYVRRAEGVLPRQGLRPPWRVHQNHLFDMMALRFGPIEDGVLEFEAASAEFQPGEAA